MGDWKLTGFTDIQYFPPGPNSASSWWEIQSPTDNSPTLDCQPPSVSAISVWGQITVRISGAQLYLDGAVTPTAYADLPEDFGIDAITYENDPLWMIDGVNTFAPDFPITTDDGNTPAFRGAGAAYYWTLEPLGLSQYKLSGLNASTITLVNPYLGVGYPPVFTKWNGFLQTLLTQGVFKIQFSQMSAQFGAYLLYVFTQFATVTDEGIVTSNSWEINGTYDSYPAPTNPTINPTGGLDFGDAATIQVLNDASGIYTLVAGQYHDELYQRIGTTSSTTVNVTIPDPFFKTGYIGGS